MRKSITPRAHILAGFREGRITKIVVPMKVQPKPSDVSRIGGTDRYTVFKPDECEQLPLPYALNAPIAVKESWCAATVIGGNNRQALPQIKYKSDYINPIKGHDRFRPPVTMPPSATRTWLVPTDCVIKRVMDLTEDECMAMGLAKVTKDGNIYKFGWPDEDGLPYGTGWAWQDWQVSHIEAFKKLHDGILDNHYIFIYTAKKEGV